VKMAKRRKAKANCGFVFHTALQCDKTPSCVVCPHKEELICMPLDCSKRLPCFFRDPNLAETLEVYDGSAAFLKGLHLDSDELTKVYSMHVCAVMSET
jgi:hypothetical protein